MINVTTPHRISSGDIKTSKCNILSGSIDTYTYNVGYYDDTAVKNRLSILESDVSNIQLLDASFHHRLNLLEKHEEDWATKTELNSVENRVTTLETIPVGLSTSQMDEILND